MEQPQNDELIEVHAPTARPPILIVDADATFARVLQTYLELQGYSVAACSAREAMRDLRVGGPRALILDFDAPGVDAYDLLASLGASELASLRVLVFSRHAEPTGLERQTLSELGVTHWLRRPCSFESIAQALERAIAGNESRVDA